MKNPLIFAASLLLAALCPRADAQLAPRAAPPKIAPHSQTSPPLGLAILDAKGAIQAVCPLQRTEVSADISGSIARVQVTQQFSNPSKTPIEALYTFPLPHEAAVDAMAFRIGTRLIKGEIKRREEAAQIYQTAKNAGQNAALLDQERPNIFSQRVANILPGQEIRVEIGFVQPLSYRAGKYEWDFPTVVGPRFVPSGGYQKPGERGAPSSDSQVPDADKITPPITPPDQRAGHDLTLDIRLQSAVALGEISSALHPITILTSGENFAHIELKHGAALPNQDFILRFAPRDNAIQSGLLTKSQGQGGFFTLNLLPPAAPSASQIAAKEMVFVIDQTGSQSGLPIQKAKETMRYCIKNLNPNDTFQLLGFTTSVNPCFEKPVAATPENLAIANKFLDGITAGGGTDILKAANYALKIPTDASKPRIICFMTDGYVGNDVEILKFVKANRGAARMFPFGVGGSVNRFLIDGMAREGRGVAEYVLLNEDGEKAARRFYNRVAKPVLLDVSVDWGGLPVADVFPKVVPDVFESAPLVVTGRYNGAGAGNVTVRGIAGTKPWSQTIPVDFRAAKTEGGDGLPSLWARSKIEDLTFDGEAKTNRGEQITAVALEFRLMSQYTSFVAVEPRVVNIGGQQKTVDVPVEMPDGVSYGGIFGAEHGARHIYAGGVAVLGDLPVMGSLFRSRAASGLSMRGSIGQNINGNAAAASHLGNLESRPISGLSEGLIYDNDISTGNEAGQKRLDALAPDARREMIRKVKMAPVVASLSARFAKEGTNGTLKADGVPEVVGGRVAVQIWLNVLSPAQKTALLAQLKNLGWQEAAVLRPDSLILGTIAVEKLDALAGLRGVRLVDVAKFG